MLGSSQLPITLAPERCEASSIGRHLCIYTDTHIYIHTPQITTKIIKLNIEKINVYKYEKWLCFLQKNQYILLIPRIEILNCLSVPLRLTNNNEGKLFFFFF